MSKAGKESSSTIPKVFIIESLDFDDEQRNHYEGQLISQILNFARLDHQYHYIRTKTELEYFIGKFIESGYRYLHISCHGNNHSSGTTLDDISFKELSLMLAPALDKKRLFLSACSAVNAKLASAILSVTDCYSIIGPCDDINMDDAAIFWASFYHLVFKQDSETMKQETIRDTIEKLAELHEVSMKYYSSSEKAKKGWKEIILK